MTKREKRVIGAFINCVRRGEFTYDYACVLIEDTDRYGYLTDAAKETFYTELEPEGIPEEIIPEEAGEA